MKKIAAYILYTIILSIAMALGVLTIVALKHNWCDPVYLTITIVLWICILCILHLISIGALDSIIKKDK